MKEQLLTANVATSLYWLGRYIERIESTLLQIITAYDLIIDVDKEAGVKLYEKLDIELNYGNAQQFLCNAILGDHASNLNNISGYARENSIISRSYINTEAFGEIIALNALFESILKTQNLIDYKIIDSAQSLISEIWGEFSKREVKKNSDNFIRLGKLVEEVDFYLRFDKDKETTMIIVDEIHAIIDMLSDENEDNTNQSQEQSSANAENIMDNIHKKIEGLIVN